MNSNHIINIMESNVPYETKKKAVIDYLNSLPRRKKITIQFSGHLLKNRLFKVQDNFRDFKEDDDGELSFSYDMFYYDTEEGKDEAIEEIYSFSSDFSCCKMIMESNEDYLEYDYSFYDCDYANQEKDDQLRNFFYKQV